MGFAVGKSKQANDGCWNIVPLQLITSKFMGGLPNTMNLDITPIVLVNSMNLDIIPIVYS